MWNNLSRNKRILLGLLAVPVVLGLVAGIALTVMSVLGIRVEVHVAQGMKLHPAENNIAPISYDGTDYGKITYDPVTRNLQLYDGDMLEDEKVFPEGTIATMAFPIGDHHMVQNVCYVEGDQLYINQTTFTTDEWNATKTEDVP